MTPGATDRNCMKSISGLMLIDPNACFFFPFFCEEGPAARRRSRRPLVAMASTSRAGVLRIPGSNGVGMGAIRRPNGQMKLFDAWRSAPHKNERIADKTLKRRETRAMSFDDLICSRSHSEPSTVLWDGACKFEPQKVSGQLVSCLWLAHEADPI